MRLKKLHLKNFKGIPEFTLEAQPGNPEIWGDNATGKTTIFDAFTWLLFNKDSLGSAKFEIKSLDLEGEAAHGLEHTVAAVLDLGDQEKTLKKTYAERWVKRRGAAKKEFTGHTVDHFVDGVPVKEKEYKAAINEICDEDAFRLLSNPRYFNEGIHWQERRKVLLEVCGDISDADVVGSDGDLHDLMTIIGKRSMEDHRKVIASRRQEINKELVKIPVRIDEIGCSAVEVRKKAAVEKDLKAAKSNLNAKKGALAEIEAGGNVAVLKTQIREIENKISAIDNTQADRVLAANREHRERILDLSDASVEATQKVEAAVKMKADLEKTLEGATEKIGSLKQTIHLLRAGWHEADKAELDFEQTGDCPTCGQALPEGQLVAARKKAVEEFNAGKAIRLGEISEEGKAAAAHLDIARKDAAKLSEEIDENDKRVHSLAEASRIAAEAVIIAKGESETAHGEDPGKRKLEKEKAAIEKQITESALTMNDETGDTREAIDQLETKIRGYQAELLQIEANARIEARITELSDQERKLAAEFEELERQLFLSEQFVRAKVAMVEEKANQLFSITKWKLFSQNINGGIDETCLATIDGVPYPNLNGAKRVNVGLDICQTLSKHYDKIVPCFIDNCESVTDILETDFQQIRLYVSEKDTTLRVE